MAHHGYTAGSIIVIDPEKGTEGQTPITRITPDQLVGEGGVQREAAYSIYLIDSLGGRELIHRDPAMSCLAPIPLKPRPKPPVMPSQVESGPDVTTGTFYVNDVYQSTQTIPRGSVKSLRVVQMYAQTIESPPSRGKAIIE